MSDVKFFHCITLFSNLWSKISSENLITINPLQLCSLRRFTRLREREKCPMARDDPCGLVWIYLAGAAFLDPHTHQEAECHVCHGFRPIRESRQRNYFCISMTNDPSSFQRVFSFRLDTSILQLLF